MAGAWMLDLLGLPANASVGFPTGAGLGNAVGLAAGRHALLARTGWDVEARGLFGAPEIQVVIGEEAHSTLLTALQYLGLGRERVTKVPVDGQGRMRAEALAGLLDPAAPALVCIQAGNVNSGAFDPAEAIADTLAAQPNGGCMSMAHSGCGRLPAQVCATWSPASPVPIHGPPTPTSG